jgi:hypothetical protein
MYTVVAKGPLWQVLKSGKVISEHDTKAAADESRLAIMLNDKSNQPGGKK